MNVVFKKIVLSGLNYSTKNTAIRLRFSIATTVPEIKSKIKPRMASGSVGLGDGETMPKKQPKSSVVLVPPQEVWDQIQEIRSKHDKAFKRWMPHINLLYPFYEHKDNVFEDAEKKMTETLSKIKPFKVVFSKASFNHFAHKKNCTLWLKPLQVGATTDESESATASEQATEFHPCVIEVQQKLEQLFPECNDLSTRSADGFAPHLSLGQFKVREVEKMKTDFQKDWTDLEFECKEIHLISRENFDDPFHIRNTIRLGTAL